MEDLVTGKNASNNILGLKEVKMESWGMRLHIALTKCDDIVDCDIGAGQYPDRKLGISPEPDLLIDYWAKASILA